MLSPVNYVGADPETLPNTTAYCMYVESVLGINQEVRHVPLQIAVQHVKAIYQNIRGHLSWILTDPSCFAVSVLGVTAYQCIQVSLS